jgi:hypothetical protein
MLASSAATSSAASARPKTITLGGQAVLVAADSAIPACSRD